MSDLMAVEPAAVLTLPIFWGLWHWGSVTAAAAVSAGHSKPLREFFAEQVQYRMDLHADEILDGVSLWWTDPAKSRTLNRAAEYHVLASFHRWQINPVANNVTG